VGAAGAACDAAAGRFAAGAGDGAALADCGFLGAAEEDCDAPSVEGKAACSFLTTGASTVEDADLTNSPMSFNLSRTVLLSTPNRFANSYTRALGTHFSIPDHAHVGAVTLFFVSEMTCTEHCQSHRVAISDNLISF
jgi:hypothetical protein